jgi:hypothetical protein
VFHDDCGEGDARRSLLAEDNELCPSLASSVRLCPI